MTISSPNISSETSSRHDFKITLVVLAAGAVNGINIAKLAPSIEVIRETFGLTLSTMGLLVSLFSLLFVAAGIIVGTCVKSVGAKRSLVMAMSLALIGTLLTIMFQNKESLFIGRVIEGIGLITVMLVGPSLVAQHTQPERRGLLMGIWSGFMPLGNALALFGVPLILLHYSWPMIWSVGFVLMLITLIFVIKIIPQDKIKASGGFDLSAIREAFSKKILMVLGFLFATHSIVYQAMLQFMPSFGSSIFGLPIFWASFVTVIFCLLSFSGNIIAGQFLQRGWTPPRLVLTAGLILFATMILMSQLSHYPVIFSLGIIILGVVTGTVPTVCFYLLSRVKTDDARNMPVFTAWLFQIQGFGMFLGPVVFATIVEAKDSWIFGIGIFAFFCLVKAGLSFALKIKDQ